MDEQKEIVRFDSDEAAHKVDNISGWVSRNGHFYGNDERGARYDGCTHMICEDCGGLCYKGWLVCKDCGEKREIKKYNAMPKEKWNGEGMLYSESADKYFSDWSEIEEYLDEDGGTMESLRLIICEPQYLPRIEYDYGCDSLAEDGELPDKVIKAIEEFNKVIDNEGAVSWIPGKKAVKL